MRRLFTIIIICFFIFHPNSHCQSMACGTVGELANGIIPRLVANKKAVAENQLISPRSTIYVPIKFHLIAKDDGSRRISASKVLDQLCEINDHFEDQNIQFFLHEGLKFIDNTELYEDHKSNQSVMAFHSDQKALNVFILEVVDKDNLSVAGYYTYNRDWIVLENNSIGKDRALTHEIGHFFGLIHPFNGWDIEAYSPEKHGSPAPLISPMGAPTEKMDGSNCDLAGDMLCDTPADFNFYGWPDCNYKGGALDPNGAQVNPDEKLFMNYFNCSRNDYYFSKQQKELIFADLISSNRFFLRTTSPANTSHINVKPTLIYPTAGVITENGQSADLFWSEVAGANQYYIEVDAAPNFTGDDMIMKFSSNASITINNLEPDKVYYWRVRPINEYYTCQNFSNFSNFKTPGITTSARSISEISKIVVAPNPVQDDRLEIQLSLLKNITVHILLKDITGKSILDFGQFDLSANTNRIPLHLDQVPSNGIYFLHLQTQRGVHSERLVVIK